MKLLLFWRYVQNFSKKKKIKILYVRKIFKISDTIKMVVISGLFFYFAISMEPFWEEAKKDYQYYALAVLWINKKALFFFFTFSSKIFMKIISGTIFFLYEMREFPIFLKIGKNCRKMSNFWWNFSMFKIFWNLLKYQEFLKNYNTNWDFPHLLMRRRKRKNFSVKIPLKNEKQIFTSISFLSLKISFSFLIKKKLIQKAP